MWHVWETEEVHTETRFSENVCTSGLRLVPVSETFLVLAISGVARLFWVSGKSTRNGYP
jgi:hypothetical protein